MMNPVIVGITGGSGALLARAAIEKLLALDVPVVASASTGGLQMWQQELGEPLKRSMLQWQANPKFSYYSFNDIGAPIASGSFPAHGMLVIPCSMATAAAIAHGFSDNLIRRAADVTIKERRPLVLVPRETPLSAIHLENLLTLARLGVVILAPEPAFYLRPQTVGDITDYLVGKALDALGLQQALPPHLRYYGGKES